MGEACSAVYEYIGIGEQVRGSSDTRHDEVAAGRVSLAPRNIEEISLPLVTMHNCVASSEHFRKILCTSQIMLFMSPDGCCRCLLSAVADASL